MGGGRSGKYYTSHGSRSIHHDAIIHSLEGMYSDNNRMKSGGHGQDAINYMKKNKIQYNILKTFHNGVRLGNIPNHKHRNKRNGTGQAWFPAKWTQKDIVAAAEHVIGLKKNSHKQDNVPMYGKWKKVWVGVIKTNGTVGTVFPDYNQSNKKRRK